MLLLIDDDLENDDDGVKNDVDDDLVNILISEAHSSLSLLHFISPNSCIFPSYHHSLLLLPPLLPTLPTLRTTIPTSPTSSLPLLTLALYTTNQITVTIK